MSSHFNYEIDEHNLRVKLKDMVMPYKEEAWVQFENYSETTKNAYKTSSFPNFQLNLNKGIILPMVFGVVIILFSLLLYRFVSINNKTTASIEKPQVTEPNPIPEKKIIPVEIKKVDTAKVAVIDSAAIKLATAQTSVSASNSVISIQSNSVQAAKIIETKTIEPSPTKSIVVNPIIRKDKGWATTENAEIFTSPDNQSAILATASTNKMYEAIEETNYYIKVSFQKNGAEQLGFIRKKQLRKL